MRPGVLEVLETALKIHGEGVGEEFNIPFAARRPKKFEIFFSLDEDIRKARRSR